MYDNWKEYMVDMYIDLYYVADDTGLVMLDDVDFETAHKYASKMDGCSAYRKI